MRRKAHVHFLIQDGAPVFFLKCSASTGPLNQPHTSLPSRSRTAITPQASLITHFSHAWGSSYSTPPTRRRASAHSELVPSWPHRHRGGRPQPIAKPPQPQPPRLAMASVLDCGFGLPTSNRSFPIAHSSQPSLSGFTYTFISSVCWRSSNSSPWNLIWKILRTASGPSIGLSTRMDHPRSSRPSHRRTGTAPFIEVRAGMRGVVGSSPSRSLSCGGVSGWNSSDEEAPRFRWCRNALPSAMSGSG